MTLPPNEPLSVVLYLTKQPHHLPSSSCQKPEAILNALSPYNSNIQLVIQFCRFASKTMFSIPSSYFYTYCPLWPLLSCEVLHETGSFPFTSSMRFGIEQVVVHPLQGTFTIPSTALNTLLKHSLSIHCCGDYCPHAVGKESKASRLNHAPNWYRWNLNWDRLAPEPVLLVSNYTAFPLHLQDSSTTSCPQCTQRNVSGPFGYTLSLFDSFPLGFWYQIRDQLELTTNGILAVRGIIQPM